VTSPTITLNEKFAPLWQNTECRVFVVTGGRGSGKSFGVAANIADRMEREAGRKILYTRQTMRSAGQSVVPEFTEKTDLMGYAGQYQKSGDDLTHPNGVLLFRGIHTSSGSQTAALKSIPGLTDWVIDEAEEMPTSKQGDNKDYDTINLSIRQKGIHNRIVLIMNPSDVSHWVYQKWFKNRGPLDEFGNPTDLPSNFNGVLGKVCYIHTTYLENLANLDQAFIDEANEMKEQNPAKYAHLFLGEWEQNLEGALWTQEMCRNARNLMVNNDDLEIVAVGIDPNVSSSGDQDDAGIVVAGKTSDDLYKVLKDGSGQHTPKQWAEMAIRLYIRWDADYIVAEVNQGGDLVEMTLRNMAGEEIFEDAELDKDAIPIKLVRAMKGKLLRAEPVATLYERGRVSHAPGLGELESELCTYTGEGAKSPGRMDALVWVLTFLTKIKIPRIRQA
jgi:phage terminase large subunit-like protein